jgi:hypothetical protein
MEILLCYWAVTFMLIFILCIDVAKRSPKFFIVALLISALLGWILVPIKIVMELVRMLKH